MFHPQRHSFINSQTDSHTFPEEMNWQFVQILMILNSSQNFVYWTPWWGKTKDFFVFCSGKMCSVCFHGFWFFCFIVLCFVLCCHPVHLFNTWIFIMNIKCRMDGSHRKPYICFSFDFLIQYSASGTCLTSVNMHKYVISLWRLWKSYIFPDLYWNSLTWLTGND